MRNRGKRLAPQPYAGLGSSAYQEGLRKRPAGLLAQITLVYTDGSTETIASDESWKYAESRVRFSEIYDGEVYDAPLNRILRGTRFLLTARGIR